jgi:hypothetical protein
MVIVRAIRTAALTGIIGVGKSGIPWPPRAAAVPACPAGAGPAWTVRASRPNRGLATGPDPTNRRKARRAPHTKRPLGSNRRGLLLTWCLSGANAHDSTVFELLLDIPPVKRPRDRPQKRSTKLNAERAYDIPRCRHAFTRRHSKIRIARKWIDSS